MTEFVITYVTRSFLDYRIPVFAALSRMVGDRFQVIYSADVVPERVNDKVQAALGGRAIALTGERRIGPRMISDFANRSLRLVYQPGIYRKISKTRPDVLVGDGFYQWTSFALLNRVLKGTPLVVTYERTFHTERNAQRLRTLYRKQVLRFVDAMAVNGRLSLEYINSLGMPEARITTGQMVADAEGLQTISSAISGEQRQTIRKQWGGANIVFLTVGRLVERKGFQELLHGWARLESQLPGKRQLVLVGGGPLESRLRRLAQSFELNNVLFLGEIDYDTIAACYASADVFVMPTLEDNWSLVVPEAMACGLPVLCSRYNGCHPELIVNDGNGWVFDPLDVQDTFLALKRCLESRDRLKAMGERSREIVAQHTPEHAAKAILAACRLALSHRKR